MTKVVTVRKYYSKGCIPCNNLARELCRVQEPYLLEHIDIEEMPAGEFKKIGIRSVPTTIFSAEGKKDVTVVGFIREPELTNIIKELKS